MKFKKILYGIIAGATAAGMLTTTLYIERQQAAAAEEELESRTFTDQTTGSGTKRSASTGESAFDYTATFTFAINGDNSVRLKEIKIESGDDKFNDSTYSFKIDKIEIPGTVTNDGTEYTVTEIGDGSLSVYNEISNNKVEIWEFTIPSGVTKINQNAFSGCSLYKITIPKSVTEIKDSAFSQCTNLNTFKFEDDINLTTIEENVFYKSGLSSIIIPKSVKVIKECAFSDCDNLTSVTFENGSQLTTIGEKAFRNTGSINSGRNITITIPNTVTTIGDYAFAGSALTSITIPGSVKDLGIGVFSGCCETNKPDNSLKTVTLKNGITTISEKMFNGCCWLNKIDIPNSVTSIGESAFTNCFSLKKIEIPDSVTSIGNYAFSSCYTEEEMDDEDKPLGLKEVKIGNSVKTIGESAFFGCGNLKEINIPGNVTSIGNEAFFDCEKLNNITIEEGVVSIGSWAFYGCSFDSVTIPKSVVCLGDTAFGCDWSGNDKLTTDKITFAGEVDQRNNIVTYSSEEVGFYFDTDQSGNSITRPNAPELTKSLDADGNVQISWNEVVPNARGYVVAYDTCEKPQYEDSWIVNTWQFKVFNDSQTNNEADDDGETTVQSILYNAGGAKSNGTDSASTTITVKQVYKKVGYSFKIAVIDKNGTIGDFSEKLQFHAKSFNAENEWLDPDPTTSGHFTYNEPSVNAPGAGNPEEPKDPEDPKDPEVPKDPEDPKPKPTPAPTPTPTPTPTPPESSTPESSDPKSSIPESSDPESSEPETTEPESSKPIVSEPDNPNPPTGIAAFLVPIVLASGAVVIATTKRKK